MCLILHAGANQKLEISCFLRSIRADLVSTVFDGLLKLLLRGRDLPVDCQTLIFVLHVRRTDFSFQPARVDVKQKPEISQYSEGFFVAEYLCSV